ncbi:GNAT family protein [Winogradskyella sp.]|uniref:GNAT family N-acetyltransferase n=1 Tax=Winogradskyella sp. TaxID=1883156 RepID=UPI0025F68CED|nr:GNAT family protein [Winogradskyella sp.]
MDIEIRKLKPKESIFYRELRLKCLKKYPMYFTSNYHDEKAKEKLFFQTYIEKSDVNNFVIGAFMNDTLIGISGFNRYDRTKINHKGRIIQVYVNPDYQGRQIGLSLIKVTIDEAFKKKGIEQIEIDVISTNKHAEKLYKKIGFIEYGIQKNFIKVGGIYYDHKMMMLFKNQYTSS